MLNAEAPQRQAGAVVSTEAEQVRLSVAGNKMTVAYTEEGATEIEVVGLDKEEYNITRDRTEVMKSFQIWLDEFVEKNIPRNSTIPKLIPVLKEVQTRMLAIDEHRSEETKLFDFQTFIDMRRSVISYYRNLGGSIGEEVTQTMKDEYLATCGEVGRLEAELDAKLYSILDEEEVQPTIMPLNVTNPIHVFQNYRNAVSEGFLDSKGRINRFKLLSSPNKHKNELERGVCHLVLPTKWDITMKWVDTQPGKSKKLNNAEKMAEINRWKDYYLQLNTLTKMPISIPELGFEINKKVSFAEWDRLKLKSQGVDPIGSLCKLFSDGVNVIHINLTNLFSTTNLADATEDLLRAILSSEKTLKNLEKLSLPSIGHCRYTTLLLTDTILELVINIMDKCRLSSLSISGGGCCIREERFSCCNIGFFRNSKLVIDPEVWGRFQRALERCTSLSEIDISYNRFGDEVGVEILRHILAGVKNGLHLQSLNVAGNYLMSEGTRVLCEIIELSSLVLLDVSHNNMWGGNELGSIIAATRYRRSLQESRFRRHDNSYWVIEKASCLCCLAPCCWDKHEMKPSADHEQQIALQNAQNNELTGVFNIIVNLARQDRFLLQQQEQVLAKMGTCMQKTQKALLEEAKAREQRVKEQEALAIEALKQQQQQQNLPGMITTNIVNNIAAPPAATNINQIAAPPPPSQPQQHNPLTLPQPSSPVNTNQNAIKQSSPTTTPTNDVIKEDATPSSPAGVVDEVVTKPSAPSAPPAEDVIKADAVKKDVIEEVTKEDIANKPTSPTNEDVTKPSDPTGPADDVSKEDPSSTNEAAAIIPPSESQAAPSEVVATNGSSQQHIMTVDMPQCRD